MSILHAAAAAFGFLAICSAVVAVDDVPTLAKDAERLNFTHALVISGVSQSARRPINLDALHAAIIDGKLATPQPGDMLPRPSAMGGGASAWSELDADPKPDNAGEFNPKDRGSYLLWRFDSEADRVMILRARGHSMLYANAEPRMGDPYGTGYVQLPIHVRKGANQLIFAHASRGPLSAVLVEPPSKLVINTADITTPDVLAVSLEPESDQHTEYLVAVPVINATSEPQHVLISAMQTDVPLTKDTPRVIIPPCSMLKIPASFPASPKAGDEHLTIRIRAIGDVTETSCEIKPKIVTPFDRRKITFVSEIDRSVQYYSVVPPLPESSDEHVPPALVLSVHGASVEATNQAAAYAPKPGVLIVCPTNRRPYGFDWEDWGRIDALEVLDHARRLFKTDPARQYVTGHSMGGHGTWQLSVLHPELFAAAAPSAGWLSFDTYAGARGDSARPPQDPLLAHFDRAAASSDSIARFPQLKDKGVYILHGDADDNVPVSEARRGKEELAKLNIDFGYHEQPGAGHWWDLPADQKSAPCTGAACVDWPPIFDMFKDHRLSVAQAEAITQRGTTPARREVVWQADTITSTTLRGPFKNAFNNNFVLVYSTSGTPEENAWSFAKARFDAEQWWYRGNGTARLVSDMQFIGGPDLHGNAIFYGNLDSNAAAKLFLKDAPFQASRTGITVNGVSREGDLAILAVAPGFETAKRRLAALVGGTTVRGMRATDRIPYFLAGVGIPDSCILQSDVWMQGPKAVLGAGSPAGSEGISPAAAFQWRTPEPESTGTQNP